LFKKATAGAGSRYFLKKETKNFCSLWFWSVIACDGIAGGVTHALKQRVRARSTVQTMST
jgi:hypothetical protein